MSQEPCQDCGREQHHPNRPPIKGDTGGDPSFPEASPTEMMSSMIPHGPDAQPMGGREQMLWDIVIRLQIENMAMRDVLVARHIITAHELQRAVTRAMLSFEQTSQDMMEQVQRRRAQVPARPTTDPRRSP